MAKRYYNNETESIETEETVRAAYEKFCADDMSYSDFIRNATDKNGALTEIRDGLTGNLYYNMRDGFVQDERERNLWIEFFGYDEEDYFIVYEE